MCDSVQECAAVARVRTAASVCRSVPTVTRVAAEIDSSATTAKLTPILARQVPVLMTVSVLLKACCA